MLAVLLLAAVAQGVWGWSDNGSKGTTYLISSVKDWNNVANLVNKGTIKSGDYVKLNNSIVFNDNVSNPSNCAPIGEDSSKPFLGTFDGDGYTISGFHISNGNSSLTHQGLFGYIGNTGIVKNFIIDNAYIDITNNAGAVAGRNLGTIENVIVYNSNILVTNNKAGGIVGHNYNGGIIKDCQVLNNVVIKCTSTSSSDIGGIVGYNQNSTVNNCSNAATIAYSNEEPSSITYYGGIVGENLNGTITNCLYLGKEVEAPTTSKGAIAGICKGDSPGSTLINNYYTQATTGGVNNADVTADDGAVPALRNDKDNTKALELLAARNTYLTSKGFSGNCAIRLYGRTLYKDGYWNTLCLPFDVTLSSSVLDGATVKTLESSSFGNGTLTLNFSSDLKTIPAGKPCIIKWANGDNLEAPLFNNVAVSVLNGSPVETINVDFIGTFSPKTLTANDNTVLYLGANSTLYYPSANVPLNAFRAYFKLKGLTAGEPTPSNTPGVRAFVLNFGDGEVSGIVDAKANPSLSEWYSLSGRRYATPTALPKGVYIHNGRKVVIK